jgi:hypothetical protein
MWVSIGIRVWKNDHFKPIFFTVLIYSFASLSVTIIHHQHHPKTDLNTLPSAEYHRFQTDICWRRLTSFHSYAHSTRMSKRKPDQAIWRKQDTNFVEIRVPQINFHCIGESWRGLASFGEGWLRQLRLLRCLKLSTKFKFKLTNTKMACVCLL